MNRTHKHITIGDVAKVAGVSKATVSLVLNNKPVVARETRKRILEVIRKLNYKPNQIARSLSVRKTWSIGLVVKQIDNPYFTKVMRGVFGFFSEKGYTVLLGSSELSPQKEKENVETLFRQRVDGLILSPLQGPGADLGYLSGWRQDRLPLTLLEKISNFAADVVDVKNAEAAAKAIEYLIRLGHRRIAYYAGPAYSLHNQERLTGFQRAMLKQGLQVLPSFIRRAGVYIDDGYRIAMEQFSGPEEKPTAVFCFNDLIAIGVMNALADLKMNVPEDVSIIGFDDIDFCRAVRVPLTSVRIPALEIGKTAAELLMRQIENRGMSPYKTVELEAPLVLRESCGQPR